MRADRPWLQYDKRKDEMKIIKIVKRVHVNRKHGSDGGVTGDIYIYIYTHTHTHIHSKILMGIYIYIHTSKILMGGDSMILACHQTQLLTRLPWQGRWML